MTNLRRNTTLVMALVVLLGALLPSTQVFAQADTLNVSAVGDTIYFEVDTPDDTCTLYFTHIGATSTTLSRSGDGWGSNRADYSTVAWEQTPERVKNGTMRFFGKGKIDVEVTLEPQGITKVVTIDLGGDEPVVEEKPIEKEEPKIEEPIIEEKPIEKEEPKKEPKLEEKPAPEIKEPERKDERNNDPIIIEKPVIVEKEKPVIVEKVVERIERIEKSERTDRTEPNYYPDYRPSDRRYEARDSKETVTQPQPMIFYFENKEVEPKVEDIKTVDLLTTPEIIIPAEEKVEKEENKVVNNPQPQTRTEVVTKVIEKPIIIEKEKQTTTQKPFEIIHKDEENQGEKVVATNVAETTARRGYYDGINIEINNYPNQHEKEANNGNATNALAMGAPWGIAALSLFLLLARKKDDKNDEKTDK